MQNILSQTHSGWRYIVIIVTVVVLAKYLFSWVTGREWAKLDRTLGMALPITYDIQLLIGLVLWLMQGRWSSADPTASWEHPVTMIIAIAVAHITWSRVKKAESSADKFRIGTIGFAVSGLIMALGVMRITRVV